jgi:hypothetical protein
MKGKGYSDKDFMIMMMGMSDDKPAMIKAEVYVKGDVGAAFCV